MRNPVRNQSVHHHRLCAQLRHSQPDAQTLSAVSRRDTAPVEAAQAPAGDTQVGNNRPHDGPC